ncbi:MAG: arsenate reductase ArsC [Candidatus Thermoplasmatota archaeon]|nr:arsenate reductase ArsC [Candidatus Thermoplasmatota archaeon]
MVTVLFICTGNAARSQMAEGLLKNMDSSLTVLSAGTKPEGLSPKATIAMKKIGIDISNQQSKKISDLNWEKANYAITLCGSANETCVSMSWPVTCTKLHWPIEDPVSQKDYESARDEIHSKLSAFLDKERISSKSK